MWHSSWRCSLMRREFHDIPQNTDEWLAMRRGRFTASTFKDLFMGPKTAGFEKAIYSPVYERLTGESPEFFSSGYMERGHELEPFGVDRYEMDTFSETSNGGFWTMGEWIGDSPDRMVESDGVLEVKCPAYNTMINYLLSRKLPPIYKWQVVGHMMATDRDWCDFLAYHPKLTPLVLRVHRDEKVERELSTKLDECIDRAQTLLNRLESVA